MITWSSTARILGKLPDAKKNPDDTDTHQFTHISQGMQFQVPDDFSPAQLANKLEMRYALIEDHLWAIHERIDTLTQQ